MPSNRPLSNNLVLTAIFILLRAKVYFYFLFSVKFSKRVTSIISVRQQLVKNLLFVLVVNILVKAIWIFMIDRNVQIRVGYESYGAFQALLNLGMIFQIVLDFGLTQYSSREISADVQKISELFSSMFWTRVMLCFVYGIIVIAVALLLGYKWEQINLLMAVLGILSLNSMLSFLRSNVAALHFFKLDGVLAVIDRLLMIIICGGLLVLPQFADSFRIEWFVWSQIACYGFAVLVAFFALAKISPVPIHFSFRPRIIKLVIIQSAPFALLVFLMSIYMRADSVMIERLCGAEGKMQAGIYASAFRLLDVANIFGIMFAGMLLPIFSRMFAQKEDIALTVRTSVNIMMPIAFVVALVAVFWGRDIMQFLYHKASNGADGEIFALLMCSFPAYCLMYIYSTLLTAKGKLPLLNKLSVAVVIVNLSLHAILIPRYQAIGAAWAVLITEWLVALLVIFYAHRNCTLPHNYRWLGAHLGFVLSVVLVAFVANSLSLDWFLKLSILLVATLLLLFLFRFWSWANIKGLLAKEA
ncbi:MAG: oligosaccharide flippase family protein [Bacteroidota bacterium]